MVWNRKLISCSNTTSPWLSSMIYVCSEPSTWRNCRYVPEKEDAICNVNRTIDDPEQGDMNEWWDLQIQQSEISEELIINNKRPEYKGISGLGYIESSLWFHWDALLLENYTLYRKCNERDSKSIVYRQCNRLKKAKRIFNSVMTWRSLLI